MPDEEEKVEAREEDAPAQPEAFPRGNVHSEPDELPDQFMPPPLPN